MTPARSFMKKILTIEDDKQLQEIYKKKLTAAGFAVIQAMDGYHGLELAKAEMPDLILLDMMLSEGMTGIDFLDQLKKEPMTSAIPVFVLSNLDHQVERAIKAGAVWYFLKVNVSIDEVIAKIADYLK